MATTTTTKENSPHRRYSDPSGQKSEATDEERDPYELRIEKSGCSEYHYKLQECYIEHNNDWRECQQEMKAFRECMSKQATNKQQ